MAGSVMRVPTLVLNEGEHISMFVGWEYGEYFWDAILDAGATLGIAARTPAVARTAGGGRVIGLLEEAPLLPLAHAARDATTRS